MPFYGYALVPDSTGKPLPDAATLVAWHVSDGTYVEAGTRLATFRVGETSLSMVICFPGGIEQRLVTEGSLVQPGQNILKWAADGESIPYGKAYFRTQPA